MTRHARLRTKEEPGLPRWMPALEGSLDDPPIVLRQDRLKLSLLCLGLTVVGGLILLIPVRVYSAWHLIFLGFLGLGIATFGAMAVRPATLILDPHGLSCAPCAPHRRLFLERLRPLLRVVQTATVHRRRRRVHARGPAEARLAAPPHRKSRTRQLLGTPAPARRRCAERVPRAMGAGGVRRGCGAVEGVVR